MRILIVEDERRMAELLRQGLTEEGHHVVLAGDGVTGFEIAHDTRFDVILLDMMLPQSSSCSSRVIRQGKFHSFREVTGTSS